MAVILPKYCLQIFELCYGYGAGNWCHERGSHICTSWAFKIIDSGFVHFKDSYISWWRHQVETFSRYQPFVHGNSIITQHSHDLYSMKTQSKGHQHDRKSGRQWCCTCTRITPCSFERNPQCYIYVEHSYIDLCITVICELTVFILQHTRRNVSMLNTLVIT